MPVLLTNVACSDAGLYCHERTLKLTPINLPGSYKNAIAATFFDLDDDTHLDILMINKEKKVKRRKRQHQQQRQQQQHRGVYGDDVDNNNDIYDNNNDNKDGFVIYSDTNNSDNLKNNNDNLNNYNYNYNNSIIRQPRNALGGWNNGYTYTAESLTLSFIHDAFFAKIFVLNGRCISWCDQGDSFSNPEPIGAMAVGATVSTLFKDVHGNGLVRVATLYSRTSYDAFPLPYTFLGKYQNHSAKALLRVGLNKKNFFEIILRRPDFSFLLKKIVKTYPYFRVWINYINDMAMSIPYTQNNVTLP